MDLVVIKVVLLQVLTLFRFLFSPSPPVKVDFLQLQMNTLRRYKRHYKLQLKPGSNKIQLVEVGSDLIRCINLSLCIM